MKKRAATALFLAVSLAFTGCSVKDKKNSENKAVQVSELAYEESPDSGKFAAQETELPGDMSYAEGILRLSGDKLLIYGRDAKDGIIAYKTDEKLEYFESIVFDDVDLQGSELIFTEAEDGNIYIAGSKEDSAILYKFSSDGKLLSESEIAVEADERICSAVYTGSGLLLCMPSKLMTADDNGNITGDIPAPVDSFFTDAAVDSGGRIMVQLSSKNYSELREIDAVTREFKGERYILSSGVGGKMFCGSGEYSLYIGGVYGITEEKCCKVVDMLPAGFNVGELRGLTALSSGDFFGITGKNESKIVRITRDPMSGDTRRTEITAAFVGNDEVSGMALEFNKKSRKYTVKTVDYLLGSEGGSPREEYDNALRNLFLDVSSGKSPDIVVMYDDDAFNELAAKGMFEDLYEFMDNDDEVSRETFLSNVLKAMETDGKLYGISNTFGARSMAIKSEFAPDGDWDIDTLESILDANSGMDLFVSANNREAVFSSLLNEQSFVDHKDHTCDFTSDRFIRLLEFCGRFPSSEEYYSGMEDDVSRNALMKESYISDFREFKGDENALGTTEIKLIGYPGTEGVLTTGAHYAILRDSKNKEGAWAFLRTYFLPENQSRIYRGALPVTEKAYRSVTEASMEAPYFIDDDGEKMTYNEESPTLSRDEYDYLDGYIRSLTSCAGSSNSTEIKTICFEEATAYFMGQRSAEEAAGLIQNRVSIYLAEKQ